jgi:anti-sigma factor ChrR (cupin superfamily)
VKPLRIPPWLWVVILIGWLITVLFVLAIPEPAGSQGVYPPPAYPTYLPPPPTIYRPTPTTTVERRRWRKVGRRWRRIALPAGLPRPQ